MAGSLKFLQVVRVSSALRGVFDPDTGESTMQVKQIQQ